MRHWQFLWHTIVLSTQYNPPEFVEHLMIFWMTALGLWWGLFDGWQYLVLSSCFAMGAAVSMGVRELIIPSMRSRWLLMLAIGMLLIYSFYAFVELAHYYF